MKIGDLEIDESSLKFTLTVIFDNQEEFERFKKDNPGIEDKISE